MRKSLHVGMLQKAKWRREHSPRTVSRLLVVAAFFALVVGLLLMTVRQSLAFLTDNPIYAIRTLDIPEPTYLSARDIAALSGVSKGENLLRICLQEVRKRLLEHPNVRDAVVRRILPDVLRIEVKEREPLAQINIGKNYLVDLEGVVLTWNEKFGPQEWPVIEGLDLKSKVVDNKIQSEPLKEALALLKEFRGSVLLSRVDIKAVKLNQPGGYVFVCGRDISLRFPQGLRATDIQGKFTQLAAVMEDLQRKGVIPEIIDLRFNDIVVLPKATAPGSGAGKKASESSQERR